MPTSQTETLKPCPFCGGKSSIVRPSGWPAGSARVVCGDCCSEGRCEYCEEDAIAAWNRRVGEESEFRSAVGGGIPIFESELVPPGELLVVQSGEVVGRITNIGTEEKE